MVKDHVTIVVFLCQYVQFKMSPIGMASIFGHTYRVRALIEAGADVNIKEKVCALLYMHNVHIRHYYHYYYTSIDKLV